MKSSMTSNSLQLDTTPLPLNLTPFAGEGLQTSIDASLLRRSITASSSSLQMLNVTSTADTINATDGVLTLREAINAANTTPGAAIINFSLGTGPQTITLTGGQLTIQEALTIDGMGKITISGNQRSRLFEVNSNVGVTLANLNLVNGSAAVGGAISNAGVLNLANVNLTGNAAIMGGAIANVGSVYLTNTTLNNNRAQNGGGINSNGYLNIRNSTFSSNSASGDGGGIYSTQGSLEIQSSTFTLNLADSDNDGIGNGGGIWNGASIVSVQNTIIAGNFDTPNNVGIGTRYTDVTGRFTDLGNNLIGDGTGSTGFTRSRIGTSNQRLDPRLAPLRNNGGFTQTHALLADSLALNAGNTAAASAVDQRGVLRSIADIGAYEALPLNLTVDLLVDENDGNLSTGDLSLREALRYITDGGTINFASGLHGTIALDLGELLIDRGVTINGSGANVLTISGNNRSRVFSIASNTTVDLNRLTIANGYLGMNAGGGAGIYNAGNLTISDSMIRDNRADGSSAIANDKNATLNLYNSTIYNNTSTIGMIGYFINSDAAITNLGTMTMRNSMVSHNQAFVSVFNNGTLTINSSTITDTIGRLSMGVFNGNFLNITGVARVKNTIIAGNPRDVSGAFISEGHNLIGNGDNSYYWRTPSVKTFINGRNGDRVGTTNAPIDPKLGALQDNGGFTWTHALLSGSPALNAADPYDRPQTDQRGVDRGSRPDIGAYENAPAIANSDTARVRRGGSITIPVLANDYDTDGDQFTIVGYTNPLNGTLTRNLDGSFTYQHRSSIFSSRDFFTYTISDSKGETSTATVQISFI